MKKNKFFNKVVVILFIVIALSALNGIFLAGLNMYLRSR